MSWWVWVLIVIGGLLVALVAVEMFLWPPVKDYIRNRKFQRKWANMTPEEREEEDRQAEYRRSERAAGMAVSAEPTLRMMGIADLVSHGDIEGLRRTFSLAQSWETRELVVVAFMNLCRDSPETVEAKRAIVLGALNDIIELSKAESSGGTYRQNCLDQAQSLADRIRNAA